uniref:ATP synthase complex subunit 8 n=1 Tax=Kraemeria cunicularia TaxID=86209 RepID=A0A347Z6L0_9GOBI|nr:ATPase subunit 8 [Kraemeria cunicularia]
MPQLNPAPWFYILVFSWLVILTLVIPKVNAHLSTNSPHPQSTKIPKTTPWAWPWP